MGWNQGYTIFEATVIGAYDLGKLDAALLDVLAEPYRGTDIDEGGSCALRTRDGLDICDVIIKVLDLESPPRPSNGAPEAEWDEYHDTVAMRVYDLQRQRWGWG